MLATWSQFKLIKNATGKERKPNWFRHLELIILQDIDTRKIKDDLNTFADMKGLAIPNLQKLSNDNRVKDWVIAKKIDSEPTLGHIVKKNSNSVFIEHWKEFGYITPSQSKLEKCKKCSCSVDPLQEFCTIRLSKKRILETKILSASTQTVSSLKQQQANKKKRLWVQYEYKLMKQNTSHRTKYVQSQELAIINQTRTACNLDGTLHSSRKKIVKIFTDSELAIAEFMVDGTGKRTSELMSIKDLELELNKVEGHSRNKWNNMADSIAKNGFPGDPKSQSIASVEGLLNRQPYKENAHNHRKIYNRNRMALFQPNTRPRNDLLNTVYLWPNLWTRLKSLSGQKDKYANKMHSQSTPVLAVLNKRKPELYKEAWCITCDDQVVKTQDHLSTCKSYEANWKISPDSLTKWFYGETQEQKKAIREEIIRNLTRRKTEQTLLKAE
ncbi:14784_t:CDS:2, partial [Gigaspora margarita]